MKKTSIFVLFLTLLSFRAFSQIMFEEGYFIDNSGQRTECLIYNMDRRYNPTNFEYKVSKNEETQKAKIEEIKEFGVNGVSKYVKEKIKVDKSTDIVNEMGYDKNPVFEEEEVFLKVLIEGKANLFRYTKGNTVRFFYQLDDPNPTQLVYKRYLKDGQIVQNNHFRQQLYQELKCSSITVKDINELKYEHNDIYKFFKKYNQCSEVDFISYHKTKKTKESINLTFRPGLNISTLSIMNAISSSRDTDFGTRVNVRLGAEMEFIFPFNKNKWAVIFEPTFQYFIAKEKTITGTYLADINYKSIENPLGIRHYFYINKNNNSKIFLNASYIFDLPLNPTVKFKREDGSTVSQLTSFTAFGLKPKRNWVFGLGYKHNDKYSVEFRYLPNRNIFAGDYAFWYSKYSTFSLIFGYTFL